MGGGKEWRKGRVLSPAAFRENSLGSLETCLWGQGGQAPERLGWGLFEKQQEQLHSQGFLL